MESFGGIKMIYRLNASYYVRGLKREDIKDTYQLWFENQEVCKYNSHAKYFKTKDWFDEYFGSLNDEKK